MKLEYIFELNIIFNITYFFHFVGVVCCECYGEDSIAKSNFLCRCGVFLAHSSYINLQEEIIK